MLRNLAQLYSILVCFVSTFIMIIVIAIGINSLTDLFLTEYKHQRHLLQYESNDNYISQNSKKSPKLLELKDTEIKEKRIKERSNYIKQKQSDAIYDLINHFGWLLSSIIFFAIHWKIYKKSNT